MAGWVRFRIPRVVAGVQGGRVRMRRQPLVLKAVEECRDRILGRIGKQRLARVHCPVPSCQPVPTKFSFVDDSARPKTIGDRP